MSILRAIGLVIVAIATPVVRFVACFSIPLALLLTAMVELIDHLATPPDPPAIPTRDLRTAAPRCTP